MELSLHALRTYVRPDQRSNPDLVQGERSTIRHRGGLYMSDKFASGTKNKQLNKQTNKQTNFIPRTSEANT